MVKLFQLRTAEERLKVGRAQVISGVIEGVEVLELVDTILVSQRFAQVRPQVAAPSMRSQR
ncbi:hypothetical protein D3C87_1646510 [compost metagenome]